jgi:hypothetical protein
MQRRGLARDADEAVRTTLREKTKPEGLNRNMGGAYVRSEKGRRAKPRKNACRGGTKQRVAGHRSEGIPPAECVGRICVRGGSCLVGPTKEARWNTACFRTVNQCLLLLVKR